MKQKFPIILLFTIYYLLFTIAPLALAQSPTPGATSPAVRQIREEVKRIVREKIDEIKKGQKRAYAGEISTISDSTLTLTTASGEQKQIKVVEEESKIIGQGRKEIKLQDLEIGNFLIAMGYIDSQGILETRRIVVMQKPKLPVREVAFGKVTDISTEKKILTVKNEGKELIWTVEVSETTKITKKIEAKVEKIKFSDIEKGDLLVAIGKPTENEEKIITAKLIHILPTD